MRRDFEHVAKKLWFGDDGMVRAVAEMGPIDRAGIEKALHSLFGASVDLLGDEADIRTALKRAREVV